jgi:Cu/Ag efflux protein CusF
MKEQSMRTFKTLLLAGCFAAIGAGGAPAFAQAAMDHSKMAETKSTDSGDGEMSDGEVRKIDRQQGKVTLRHGEIKSLDMPPMTMVFSVKDKTMLDTVKPGDKVKFKAANENGKLTVMEMTSAK